MEPSPKQQAAQLIERATNILIAPGRPDGDSLGSALALLLVLKKLGKETALAVLDPVAQRYQFLPAVEQIATTVEGGREFVITLENQTVEPDKLSYNIQDGKLNIIITAKKGNYAPEDVQLIPGEPKHDLIITLDAPDLTQLGELHNQYPALFREIPIINVDHHSTNAYFGTVNVVDITATSTGEILVGLIEALGQNLIDVDVATCLLTGIISDTGSFQHANTTPKSLTVAAQMVAFGARQQEIIKHLFKTKQLTTLKLWGQVLSRLQFDPQTKFAWATATFKDLEATGASKEDFTGLIDELMTSIPGAEVVLLLTEREPGMVYGSIRTAQGVDAAAIAGLLGGGGHPGAAAFQLLDMSLDQAQPVVLEKVTGFQAARLGLTPAGVSA